MAHRPQQMSLSRRQRQAACRTRSQVLLPHHWQQRARTRGRLWGLQLQDLQAPMLRARTSGQGQKARVQMLQARMRVSVGILKGGLLGPLGGVAGVRV